MKGCKAEGVPIAFARKDLSGNFCGNSTQVQQRHRFTTAIKMFNWLYML
jgi:hypothetical protein